MNWPLIFSGFFTVLGIAALLIGARYLFEREEEETTIYQVVSTVMLTLFVAAVCFGTSAIMMSGGITAL